MQSTGEFGDMENVSIANTNYTILFSCNFTETVADMAERNMYILPWWQQLAWSVVFGGMVAVATGGNLIVIWIVLSHRRMRTVTNYFIVNLSIADIMVSTLNVIFNFVYMLGGDWLFGTAYCKFSNFIAVVSVAASVFTLIAITIDRYVAIMSPLRARLSRKATINIALCIWLASSILSLPNAIYSDTQREEFANGDSRVICYLFWPDGVGAPSVSDYVYNMVIMIVTYVVPVIALGLAYFRVGRELWGSQGIGESTSRQLDAVRSKRKIVKMMIVVVTIFTICWFPYHLYFILVHHYPHLAAIPSVQHIYLSIYWLAMSNSMYNPLIYCWMK